jgi:hypothetical protein
MDAMCDSFARTFHAPPQSLHRWILAQFVIRFRGRDARAESALDGRARVRAHVPCALGLASVGSVLGAPDSVHSLA